ncbi:MAG: helix-turn-helix transcriptional regulator [Clostridia bacterium]|nr:helix-turn-helix transcriptional regulator [Clostridia bacterium]
MPKVVVDKKLSDTLKAMRLERSIQAKELAEKWGKTASYISKLENGIVKSIDYQELIKCLRIIVGKNSDEYIDELVKTVNYKFSASEIDELLWMDNFDMVFRRIPIPTDYVSCINNMMIENGITVTQLVDQINTNEFMPKQLRENEKIPTNIWMHDSGGTYIKMSVDYNAMENMLSREKKKQNYVFLLATTLYLFRLIDYASIETYAITSDQYSELKKKATEYLETYKIYTSFRKQAVISQANSSREIEEKLSQHDKDNLKIVRDVYEGIAFFSDFDVASANILLKQFNANMQWDSPFIMEIAGMPFSELGNCSHRIKQDIINQIRKILDDTLEIPENERRMEKYS